MNDSHMQTRNLLAQVSDDSRDALVRLIEFQSSRLLRFFSAQVGANDAEDLMQEFWVRVWLSRKQYRVERGGSRWLYTIATRIAIDFLRAKPKEIALEGDELAPFWAADGLDHSRIQKACLDCLPERQRLVFYLCIVEGWTPTEAARLAHMNGSTVRNHLAHVRKKLSAMISAAFPEFVPRSPGSSP